MSYKRTVVGSNRERIRGIKASDLLCIMDCLREATKECPEESAKYSDQELKQELDMTLPLTFNSEIVEHFLWAAKQCEERGTFKHFDGLPFTNFCDRVIGEGKSYREDYGWVDPRERTYER